MITYTITLDAALSLWEKGDFSAWFKDTSNAVYYCQFYDEDGGEIDDMVIHADELSEFPFGDYREEAETICQKHAKTLSESYMFGVFVSCYGHSSIYVFKTQEKALKRAQELFKDYSKENNLCEDDLKTLYDLIWLEPYQNFRLEDIDIEIKKFKEGDDIL